MKLLDWRLRRVVARTGLPPLPEVRRYARLCYWNGFTFGALGYKLPAARAAAKAAVVAAEKGER